MKQRWLAPVLILLSTYPLMVVMEGVFAPVRAENAATPAYSSTPTSLPPGSINVSSSCIYIKMSQMNINIFGSPSMYTNTSTALLAALYSCNDSFACGDKQTFNRTYLDSDGNPQFWIYFEFSQQGGPDNWSLSQLKHRNISQLNSLFTYDNCGSTVSASPGQGYKCGTIICYGNEYNGSTSIESQMTMHNVTFEAFRYEEQHAESYIVCGKVSPSSQTVYIVVGLVVGGAVVLAIVVIFASFAYKRWRYGPYNLLD